jgi:hypothetical protein
LASPAKFDALAVFSLVFGVVLISAGMYVGFGRLGDALVLNNPDSGTLFSPLSVSRTMSEAGFAIGFFVSVGSAFIAIAVRKWK